MSLGRAWRSASVLCLAVTGHGAGSTPLAGTCPYSVNYCAELIPTPAYPRARAVLELIPVPSPFNVALTRDGSARYRIVISIAGIPRPTAHDNAPAAAYVAWMTTMDLDSVVKLGPVTGGRTVLGETTRDQFRILISAERSAASRTRTGRLVFRGTSPGSRLLAHRDAISPFQAATMMAPMPAMGMPGMTAGPASGMVPDIPPFLPAAAGAASLQPAQPREIVHLHSGDTLSLTAMLVRRTVAGRTFTAYAYNGQIPGPLIDVTQGTRVVVQFHNAMDLPSAVHWHGLRLDSASDGAVGISQNAVAPGGTFTYRVRFPDAGIFWYHSHEREDIQQPLGLYGNIIVRPRSSRPLRANAERILAVGDMLLADSAPVPFGTTGPTHVLMGRFGNVMLVNGAAGYRDTVHRGAVVRYYLTNVSNARVLNLAFGNGRVKVVSAGAGPFVREVWANSVVIAPAERYVVDVRFSDSGIVAVTNRVQALDHLTGAIHPETDTVALVRVDPATASPDYAGEFAALRLDDAMSAENGIVPAPIREAG